MSQKTQPKVTCIVLNYNGIGIFEEALDSLKLQTYKNMEVVIADDASKDDSVKLIKKNYPWVKVLVNPKNSGTAGVSNYAVSKIGKCDYLVLMSNDMYFHKDCVKELVKTMESDKKIGLTTAVLVKHDPDPITKKYYIDNAGIDVDRFLFIYPHLTNQDYATIIKDTEEIFASCGGCYIIKPELYKEVGGFDEKYWSLSEDIDMSWRIRLLGYKIMVNKKAFLYHHIHKTLKNLKMSRTRYLSERNNLMSILKNYSNFSLLKVLPVYILLEIGEILFFLVKLRPDVSWAIIRAFWHNVSNISSTLEKRKSIQATRKIDDKKINHLMYKGSYKLDLLPGLMSANLK